LLVAVGLMIRLKILETPMFAKLVAQRKTARTPVAEVIRRHWREILLSARRLCSTPFWWACQQLQSVELLEEKLS
jgi:hypothetical protein